MKATGHGGVRRGAGRKPVFANRVLRSVSFERDDLRAADALARKRGVRVSLVIRDALRAYLRRRKE
jgi:hypothetical protein